MNEVVIPSVLQDGSVRPPEPRKQNLLDLDREGLERFFADTLG
ncbi:23S rRNA (adenine(2503)-C(2))-methyltransferase RlmN, partial [Xanthomonas perforans]